MLSLHNVYCVPPHSCPRGAASPPSTATTSEMRVFSCAKAVYAFLWPPATCLPPCWLRNTVWSVLLPWMATAASCWSSLGVEIAVCMRAPRSGPAPGLPDGVMCSTAADLYLTSIFWLLAVGRRLPPELRSMFVTDWGPPDHGTLATSPDSKWSRQCSRILSKSGHRE